MRLHIGRSFRWTHLQLLSEGKQHTRSKIINAARESGKLNIEARAARPVRALQTLIYAVLPTSSCRSTPALSKACDPLLKSTTFHERIVGPEILPSSKASKISTSNPRLRDKYTAMSAPAGPPPTITARCLAAAGSSEAAAAAIRSCCGWGLLVVALPR